MVAVAGSAVALAYLGTGSTKLGCGRATVLLTFHVLNVLDGRPVAGAKIALIRDYSGPPAPSVISGVDGSAQVRCDVGATWYSGPFFREYRCLYYGDAVEVQAQGYRSVEQLLREYTNDPAYHNSSVPPPIVIRLKRSPESKARRG
jgi:5-hydroxyisourate hydrolase-like protein (transthyretin family)